MSAVSTSGSTAIRVRTSAAPTGFAVSTTIRRPGPTASATRPPDSFTTTTATAIKISPTASLFFKGTEVDEKSVPCDAVFYGATITTDVYNPAGYGYRIPDNDLYSTKNLLSGVGQPFFGQGTNTFLFPDGGNDAGEFVFFGGSFTQGGCYRGRSAVCRKLAADASGSLADIESGDGVTTYL